MTQTQDVIRRRRMVRRFDPDRPVDPGVVDRAVTLALRAPSAGFSQGWDFVVLTDPASRRAFWDATAEDPDLPDAWLAGVMGAPVVILCCSDKDTYLRRYAEPDKPWQDKDESHWPAPYWDIDTGMAALLMLLVAEDEGVGGLLFGVPAEGHDSVHEEFAIPKNRTIVGAVALGYPKTDRPQRNSKGRRRRPVEEVVHRERFGVPYTT